MAKTFLDIPRFDPTAPDAIEALTTVFEVYNETTLRMQEAHSQLQGEVVRLRCELQQKNEELDRKSRLAALGEMAAGMAHEIRNPLGGVQLYASLLERDLEKQPDQLQWVRKISSGVRHLNQIVSDILAFTQDQNCTKTSIGLAGLLAEVLDYVRPQVQNNKIQVQAECSPADMIIRADINMLRREMLNLALNGIEAAGVDGQLQIFGDVPEDKNYTARIVVADSGPGIEAEVMPKMFNPFFTTKDQGIGLGLAIVHRLMESQGGVVRVANGPGGGAVFTLLLP